MFFSIYSKISEKINTYSPNKKNFIKEVEAVITTTTTKFINIKNYILKNLRYREYDLPLNESEDTKFLILLVGLMSFLAVLACSGAFALNNMTKRWSSGLENKVTIEIPVETKEGILLSNITINEETEKLAKKLKSNKIVKSIKILTNEEIQELISPWIGKELTLNDIPLPGLIALELKNSDKKSIEKLRLDIKNISEYAYLETHHEWLKDLISFTNSLKALSVFIAIIIGATTIIAISAGVRTRLAIHNKEVELLHHMGASDSYIAHQFQRHAMILALKGGGIGTLSGLIVTAVIIIVSKSKNMEAALIPSMEISFIGFLFLLTIPIIAAIIAIITSRFTVLRSLTKMP